MATALTQSQARWGVRATADAVLASYSQVFFGHSRWVGGVLLAATMLDPRVGAHGLVAVLLAMVTARVLRFADELTRAGLYGYNALLIGLGTAVLMKDSFFAATVLVAGVVLSVFVTAAGQSANAVNRLPVLTIPFLIVYYLIIATATSLGLPLQPLPVGPELGLLPAWLQLFLKSLGMIFFLPRVDVGALVLLAIIIYSRLATLYALIGLGLAVAVMHLSALSVLAGDTFPALLTLNLAFTSIALGGVWFVPSRSALVLAVFGSLAAAAVTVSAAPIMARFGLPILILPFNLTVFLVLYAFRQRTRDQRPKSVAFVPGSPERNFSFDHTHVARFGAHYALRLRAPFSGAWVCTQSIDGEHTHRGVWRHAFDFEVANSEGARYDGRGTLADDYYCYGLPVLATAAGTVVKVENGVPDNPIGQPNLRQNWGNLVLVRHAPGLYSLVSHLVPGSVVVHEGQWVTAGQQLAKCGNSGRSVVPHLHFQLQALPIIGAPTIETELHDVVVDDGDGADRVGGTVVVAEGQSARNLRADDAVRHLFDSFLPGEELALEIDGRVERVQISIDLSGAKIMRSDLATLYFDSEDDRFIVYDVVGSRRSALHVLRAALGRVPFEDNQQLRWRDHLSVGVVRSLLATYSHQFFAPFVGLRGIEIEYSMHRDGKTLEVRGTAAANGAAPQIRTRATFESGVGWVSARLETPRGTTVVSRAPPATPEAPDETLSRPSRPAAVPVARRAARRRAEQR